MLQINYTVIMFVIKPHEDKIIIPPSATNKEQEVYKELQIKYSNKIVQNHGIGITIKNISEIKSYKIVNGYLQADVQFELVIFKFFVDEIVYGRVIAQEEEYLKIGLPFYNSIYVYLTDSSYEKVRIMPENGTKHCTIWYWTYDGNKYYIKNNEKVRVRITQVIYRPYKIIGSLDDTGLGPLSWWQ